MDPMTMMAVASVAAPVVSGILGGKASKAEQARAQAALDAAYAEIEKVGAPPDLSAAIIIQKLNQAGVLTPEMESNISAGMSELAQHQEATQGRDAQVNALQLLSRASKEGLGATERADLNKLRTQAAQDAEARRQQLLQNMQARGIAGSGAELASQLAAQQGQYQVASEEGDRMAAQAQQRALQAMQASASTGGQLRGSDLAYAETTKGAADEFKKFDTANQIGVQSRNVGSVNNAQASNLGEKQRIQDTNTDQANAELYRQNEAKRQFWQDKLDLAKTKANALTGQASQYNNNAAAAANRYAGMGSAISGGLATLAARK